MNVSCTSTSKHVRLYLFFFFFFFIQQQQLKVYEAGVDLFKRLTEDHEEGHGMPNAIIESSAQESLSQTQADTQVPHGHEDLHFGTNVGPVSLLEEASGGTAGVEQVAFVWGDLGPQSVEIAKGGGICCLHSLGMVGPNAKNDQVVRKRPRGALLCRMRWAQGWSRKETRVILRGHP